MIDKTDEYTPSVSDLYMRDLRELIEDHKDALQEPLAKIVNVIEACGLLLFGIFVTLLFYVIHVW